MDSFERKLIEMDLGDSTEWLPKFRKFDNENPEIYHIFDGVIKSLIKANW